MKGAYPIVLRKTKDGYYVEIPDFDSATEGKDLVDAIEMARDAIGILGISYEDQKMTIPKPNSTTYSTNKNDIVTLVDVDFTDYRKKADNRAVKKNCTIPYWMSVEADKAGINYSKVLQDAIAKALNYNYNLVN